MHWRVGVHTPRGLSFSPMKPERSLALLLSLSKLCVYCERLNSYNIISYAAATVALKNTKRRAVALVFSLERGYEMSQQTISHIRLNIAGKRAYECSVRKPVIHYLFLNDCWLGCIACLWHFMLYIMRRGQLQTEMLKSRPWYRGFRLGLSVTTKRPGSVSTPEFWSRLRSGGQNFGLGRF